MTLASRLERLVPDLARTVARFPVPVAASVALCVYSNLQIAGAIHQQQPDEIARVTAALAAAFFGSGAAHLYAEGLGISRITRLALALVAAMAAGALGYSTTALQTDWRFLFPAILLLLMIAPYLRAGARQAALWLFDLRLGLAALLAVVVAVAFAGGLSAIVESLVFLFDVRLPTDRHQHVWSTAASLVAPLYGLALTPQGFDEEVDIAEEQGTLLERGVSVLVNYVLVPMVAIYVLILHAYAVKVAVNGALPRGQIGTLVAWFALTGTGAWLVAWPWRERGTRLLRWFMTSWFWLTIVPAVLLAVAVWRRISDYGVTPDRYAIAIIGVWLACLAIYLGVRRNRADLRHILGGLAVLLLIGAFGPWGAVGISVSDQFSRLAQLLELANMLKDGRLVEPLPRPPEAMAQQADSIIWLLSEIGALDRLKPWFEGRADDPFRGKRDRWQLTNKIHDVLGFPNCHLPADFVSFTSAAPFDLSRAGNVRIVGPIRLGPPGTPGLEEGEHYAKISGPTLELKVGDRRWEYPVRDVLEKAKQAQAATPSEPAVLETAPDLSILLVQASGTIGDAPILNSAELWIIHKQ